MEKYVSCMKRVIVVLGLERLLAKDKKTVEMVEVLYRRQDKRTVFLQLWCKRLIVLSVAAAAAVLFFVVCLSRQAPEDVIVDGTYLQVKAGQEQATFGVVAETGAGSLKGEMTVDVGAEKEKGEKKGAEATPDPREVLLSDIREAVEKAVSAEEAAREQGKSVPLPETVSGTKVRYENPKFKKDFTAFYLCLSVIVLLPFVWNRQRQEKLKERDQQMLLDYPEMVNKIMLLLSAGLTVRGCFDRICGEYRRRMAEGGERRYVYEEICFSLQEMEHGVSETDMLEAFGKRCRLLPYLRFSTMMNQNIRKGSESLIALLEAESLEAFEKRKEQVKVMGETAGTKMLLPMVLMLGVVMVIIVVPAFMTM